MPLKMKEAATKQTENDKIVEKTNEKGKTKKTDSFTRSRF